MQHQETCNLGHVRIINKYKSLPDLGEIIMTIELTKYISKPTYRINCLCNQIYIRINISVSNELRVP